MFDTYEHNLRTCVHKGVSLAFQIRATLKTWKDICCIHDLLRKIKVDTESL